MGYIALGFLLNRVAFHNKLSFDLVVNLIAVVNYIRRAILQVIVIQLYKGRMVIFTDVVCIAIQIIQLNHFNLDRTFFFDLLIQ